MVHSQPPPPPTKVLLTNLPEHVQEEELSELFADLSLVSCTALPNGAGERSRRAVIEFYDPADVGRAISAHNYTSIGGNMVYITAHTSAVIAQPRTWTRKKRRNWNGHILHGQRPAGFIANFPKPLREHPNEFYSVLRGEELDENIVDGRVRSMVTNVAGRDPTILLHADSQSQYANVFRSLLFAEEIRMHVDIRQYDLENQTIDQHTNMGLYKIDVPGLAEKRPSILRGDLVKVQKHVPIGAQCTLIVHQGFVHFVNLDNIFVSFHRDFARDNTNGAKFDIQFTFTRTPLRIQHRAIKELPWTVWHRFTPRIMASYGSYQVRVSRCFGHVRLNSEQMKAVEIGLSAPKVPIIIHGPPGTGKTATVVELILQVLRTNKSARILVCTPSNNAADHLAGLLMRSLSATELLRLNALQRNHKTLEPPALRAYCSMDGNSFTLPLLSSLQAYRVVVATCIASGYLVSMGVVASHFTHIFVDEAAEALETETLVPLQLATDSTVLVLSGDHKQLGPIVRSPVALEWRFDRSLMERAIEVNVGAQVVTLKQSYRAHPALLELYSRLFYNGELVASANMEFVTSLCKWKRLPNPAIPLMFVHSEGEERRDADSPSWYNQRELEIVKETAEALLQDRSLGLTASDIGIISPYRKQIDKLRQYLHNYGDQYKGAKLGTVENFQGQERKVIIISLVRSRQQYLQLDAKFKLGFCSNPKRLNVAISRAQCLLVIVGNATLFGSNDPNWRFLLEYCKLHNLFYGTVPKWEGSSATAVTVPDNQPVADPEHHGLNVDQAWREDY